MSIPNPLLPKRPSIRRQFFAPLGFLLAMLGVILLVTWKSADVFLRTAGLVAESRETREMAEKAMRHILEMQHARRGFMMSGNEALMQEYDRAGVEVADAFRDLRGRLAGRPDQKVRIDLMELLVKRMVEAEKPEIAERRKGPLKDGSPLIVICAVRARFSAALSKLVAPWFSRQAISRTPSVTVAPCRSTVSSAGAMLPVCRACHQRRHNWMRPLTESTVLC